MCCAVVQIWRSAYFKHKLCLFICVFFKNLPKNEVNLNSNNNRNTIISRYSLHYSDDRKTAEIPVSSRWRCNNTKVHLCVVWNFLYICATFNWLNRTDQIKFEITSCMTNRLLFCTLRRSTKFILTFRIFVRFGVDFSKVLVLCCLRFFCLCHKQ
jgi:hypothetical protein